MPRRNGKIRIRALMKFLNLYILTRERNRPLTVDEIMGHIHCSRGHAYNYQRALGILLPATLFKPKREEVWIQRCLTT